MYIVIPAFEKYDNVIAQFESIYDDDNFYSIHYNFRSVLKNPKDFILLKKFFKKYKNVRFYTKHKVFWGHSSIVKIGIENEKKFLKSNHDYFLFLCQKTINLYDMKTTRKKIDILLKKGFDFMNFSKKNVFENKFTKPYAINRKENKEIYTTRNFKRRTVPQNSKFYIFWYLFYIFLFLIKKPSRLKKIEWRHPISWYRNNNDYNNKVNDIFWILSNSKKIPKIIKDWEFSIYNYSGHFTFLRKEDLLNIYSSKLNRKKIKSFRKYINKKWAPEEFYYPTIYWNLIHKKNKALIEKSIPIFGTFENCSKKENILYFKKNFLDSNILFVKRCLGESEITTIKKLLK